jgi:hypothetical protein
MCAGSFIVSDTRSLFRSGSLAKAIARYLEIRLTKSKQLACQFLYGAPQLRSYPDSGLFWRESLRFAPVSAL